MVPISRRCSVAALKTYASVTGGGFWDASAEVLNKSETYAGCIYA
jgi:hypothetical protein